MTGKSKNWLLKST